MIITQKKPIEELMAMIGDAKKIAIIGCASCAQACATGGEAQVAELKAYLEAHGKQVVATAMSDYCCMNGMTRNIMLKKINPTESRRGGRHVLRRRRAVHGEIRKMPDVSFEQYDVFR